MIRLSRGTNRLHSMIWRHLSRAVVELRVVEIMICGKREAQLPSFSPHLELAGRGMMTDSKKGVKSHKKQQEAACAATHAPTHMHTHTNTGATTHSVNSNNWLGKCRKKNVVREFRALAPHSKTELLPRPKPRRTHLEADSDLSSIGNCHARFVFFHSFTTTALTLTLHNRMHICTPPAPHATTSRDLTTRR